MAAKSWWFSFKVSRYGALKFLIGVCLAIPTTFIISHTGGDFGHSVEGRWPHRCITFKRFLLILYRENGKVGQSLIRKNRLLIRGDTDSEHAECFWVHFYATKLSFVVKVIKLSPCPIPMVTHKSYCWHQEGHPTLAAHMLQIKCHHAHWHL